MPYFYIQPLFALLRLNLLLVEITILRKKGVMTVIPQLLHTTKQTKITLSKIIFY